MVSHTFAVVPYGESQYLEACLTSVLNQRDASQVLVSTSTPNKHIAHLCEKYALPLHINRGIGGICDDWNFAISCASTQYITLCHQDDIYLPGYRHAIIEAIQKVPDALIHFTDYGELRGSEVVTKSSLLRVKRLMLLPVRLKHLQSRRLIKRAILSLGNPICCPSVTYHLSKLPRPLFQGRFKSNLDWQAWEQFSRLQGHFSYIPKVFMLHRIHAASTTSKIIGESLRSQEDEAIFRLFWPPHIAAYLAKRYAASEKSNRI